MRSNHQGRDSMNITVHKNKRMTRKTFTLFVRTYVQEACMRTIAGHSSPKKQVKDGGHDSHIELVHVIRHYFLFKKQFGL